MLKIKVNKGKENVLKEEKKNENVERKQNKTKLKCDVRKSCLFPSSL